MAFHSIVLPIFNEAEGINLLYERMSAVIQDIGEPCEIILVNDGSHDRSAEQLDRLHQRDARFKVVHFSRNFGHQIAITAGIAHASGDTVTVIDADMQDPPELIKTFIARWRAGHEVVYGVRRKRAGETLFKLLTAKIFYRLIRSMTQLDIPVDTGDFRLMDRKVVDVFLSLPERNRYVRGLICWIGFRQVGVPYDRAERVHGETHYPLRKMLKFAFDGIVSFSSVPLRLATWLGFLASATAFVVSLWAIYLRFFTDKTVPGWSSLILTILFLGGFQLLCLGLVGEYLGRMSDEVRQRPLYVISRSTGLKKGAIGEDQRGDRAA